MLFTYATLLAYGQQIENDTVTTSNLKEAERLIDKYGEKTVDAFNNLVEKATPLAVEGFNMAVKMQIAEGVSRIVPLIAFIISFILFKKMIKDYEGKGVSLESRLSTDSATAVVFAIYVVLIVVSFICTLVLTYGGITRLIAPEWYAIKEIIELVK